MTTYTVSNLAGVTADYTTINAAMTAIRNQLDTDNEIKVLGGTYDEEVQLHYTLIDNTTPITLDLIFTQGANMRTTTKAVGIRIMYTTLYTIVDGLQIINADVQGFSLYQMQFGDFNAGRQIAITLDSCIVVGDMYLERGVNKRYNNCTFSNGTALFSVGGNGGSSVAYRFKNNTLSSFNDFIIGHGEGVDSNLVVDSKLTILTDYSETASRNIFSNVDVRSAIRSTTINAINALPYQSVSNITELNAIITPLVWGAEDVYFQSVTLGAFNYPTVKTEATILNRHIGANRYAITQTVPIANADYTNVAGVYESNKVSPNPLVYIAEATRAGQLRTATLHFTRSGNTEQLGANGQVEILVETSTDGTNYTTLGTFLSGIDSSTLDFDFLNTPAKAIRASIQPTGAAFGELHFEGITVDFKTFEDRLSQTDTRILYTAGNIPANVSELYNRALNNPIANFTQTTEAEQFGLSSSGGLVSLDGNRYMVISTGAILSPTYSTQLTFKAQYSASTQVFLAHRNNLLTSPYQIFIDASSTTEFSLTVNYRDIYGTIKTLVKAGLKFGYIYTVSVVLNAEKLTYSLYINYDTILNTSVLPEDVAEMREDFILGATFFTSYSNKIASGSKIYDFKYYDGRAITFDEHKENYRTDQFNNEHLR